MATLYKLTDQDMRTFGGFQWELGQIRSVAPATRCPELCTDGVTHAYHDPLVAVLMNPAHASYSPARLFAAEAPAIVADDGLKCGVYALTLVREMDVPQPTLLARAFFGVMCAQQVCTDARWNRWAEGYLSGKDRSTEAANVAYAAYAASAAAAHAAAAYAAAHAAHAASYAAADAVKIRKRINSAAKFAANFKEVTK